MDALISYAADRRLLRRYRVLKDGQILLPDGRALPVSIRNLSVQGARIWFAGDVSIPPKFDLLIVSERLIHCCELRWHSGRYAGLEFVGDPRHLES